MELPLKLLETLVLESTEDKRNTIFVDIDVSNEPKHSTDL